MRRALPLVALAAALISAIAVYLGYYGTGVFVVYLGSLASLILALLGHIQPRWPRLDRRRLVAALPALVLVVLQLALARYFGSFPQHFQHDEFITAFISYQLPDISLIQWFVGYPDKDAWVAQFPIIFFALQKPFFMLLGPTVDAVRISVWPYLALTTIYLYLIARELSPRPAFAFVAGLCAIIFAPNLYLSSIGVHFHSATFFLVASSYHLLRLLRTERRADAVLCGLFAAAAYLTYPSSYIALPLLLGFVALESLARRSTRPLRLFLPSLAVFAFTLLPFVVSALTGTNFLLERVEQVNAFGGTIYGQPALARGDQAQAFLLWQVEENVMSLYEPGHAATVSGYLFGNQAFFSPLALCLFILGSLVGLYRAAFHGERGYLLVSAALLAAFASGMLLTLPAGAFHRVSVVYPFVGLTIALGAFLPVAALDSGALRRLGALPAARVAALALVAAFCVTSLSRASQMVQPDQTHDSPTLARYVEENVPEGDTVGIAFARNYHLGRELFFRTGGRQFVTGSVADILADPPSSVFVLAYPTLPDVIEIRERFPGALFVVEVDGVRMRDHYIVVTAGRQAGAR